MSESCHVKADRLVSPVYYSEALKYVEHFKCIKKKSESVIYHNFSEKIKSQNLLNFLFCRSSRIFNCYI